MKCKQFYITTPQATALAELSMQKEMPEAEIIRRALDEYFYAEERRKRFLDHDEYGPLENEKEPL